MNKCETCKHWRSPAEQPFVREGDPWGTCERTEAEDGMAKDKGSLAHAADGESYWAVLCTVAEFGCMQWEAK